MPGDAPWILAFGIIKSHNKSICIRAYRMPYFLTLAPPCDSCGKTRGQFRIQATDEEGDEYYFCIECFRVPAALKAENFCVSRNPEK